MPALPLVLTGDARALPLAAATVQCVVTSPPYYGLRDYGAGAQIGLEATPDAYIAELVAVFREVWRVLHPSGTAWLNLGDSYNAAGRVGHGTRQGQTQGTHRASAQGHDWCRPQSATLKPKDLLMLPARVALALQADGWTLRDQIVWAKAVSFCRTYTGSVMPESVRDRCTKSYELVYMLAKSPHYYADMAAVKEQDMGRASGNGFKRPERLSSGDRGQDAAWLPGGGRNPRNVWAINPEPSDLPHFAMMPQALAEKCVLIGSRPGDVVLDPFGGAGTTALVAYHLGRQAVTLDVCVDYAGVVQARLGTRPTLFPLGPGRRYGT